jgi:hypothetical protein
MVVQLAEVEMVWVLAVVMVWVLAVVWVAWAVLVVYPCCSSW